MTALLLTSCGGGNSSDSPLPSSANAPTYAYFAVGNPDASVSTPTEQPGASYALVGGGYDVDEAFRWMIRRAGITANTGGRFVIIRASGTDAYNPYIFYSNESLSTSGPISNEWVGGASLGLTSVETLVIPSAKAANDPFVNRVVGRANAVFIAGGDQADYIVNWSGTALQRTLKALVSNHVPLGGTSAGLAVMGQFVFSALHATIYSEEALANPYDPNLTLDPDPLNLSGGFIAPPELAYTILDSHFGDRDRMGRLITFVSRLVASNGQSGCAGGILPASLTAVSGARGIGIDAETALLVQSDPLSQTVSAQVVTNSYSNGIPAVYFVRPSVGPTTCQAGVPLSINSVEIKKLADTHTVFDLSNWRGVPTYEVLDVVNGTLSRADWQ